MTKTGEKLAAHEKFWQDDGPCLILIPTGEVAQYDTEDYPRRFENPELMWEGEMHRARAVLDWPTDGIPTVRPNLGTTFIPAIAGQNCIVQEGQMPWPGGKLSREAIQRIPSVDIKNTKLMRLALEFYDVHRVRGSSEVVAYHPDTQGIFSIAHLLYGDQIFLDLVEDAEWVRELMEIVLELHGRVVRMVKSYLGERPNAMVHGHGTPQGVYFPSAGLRLSEDTATTVSPKMMEEFILPYLERASTPFDGAFVHYCGRHPFLFERLCRSPHVRDIDLGNPEMYDTRWLLEQCAATGTVLFSLAASEGNENWRDYMERLAGLIKETGARLILRPAVFPKTREDCARMRDLWHEWTD
jgi:hypothetical protein